MLSIEDNDLLTQVGPGTPMGEVMRRYWLPFMYSWELEEDGAPLRVRLLGEDLIAFRDSAGQVGLVANACAHRGASLFFGRNEDCGLRCVYHGWKYDVAGNCVDMPNEPAGSNFREKIHLTAYRCAEQGGMIFTYMGRDQATAPGLPQLDWAMLPETHVYHEFKAALNSNYMQNLEGDIDSSHTGFLHSGVVPGAIPRNGITRDRVPRLEIVETEYGTMYSARRTAGPDRYYWRTAQFIMPIFTLFPGSGDGQVPSHIWVPIDDHHTLSFGVKWNPTAEWPDRTPSSRRDMDGTGPMLPEQRGTYFAHWWPEINVGNDFAIDREAQKTTTFTGIPTIRLQDAAMTTSMGAITNRTREHLGTVDAMIIRTRQRLLRAARALRDEGTPPPICDRPDLFRVRSSSALLPAGVDWRTELEDWHLARTDRLLPSQEETLVGAGSRRPGAPDPNDE